MHSTEETRGDVERWSMLAAGSALVAFGAARGGLLGKAAALCGGVCAVQGWRGKLGSPIATDGVAEAAVTIAAPAAQVAEFWRDPQRLAGVVPQIERIDRLEHDRSTWVVTLPGNLRLHWEAEYRFDESGRRITWQTTGSSTLEHEGEVTFAEAPGDRGTEVRVRLRWRDPSGGVVEWLTRRIGGVVGHAPRDELRRGLQAVKQVLEAGEIPTSQSQPARTRFDSAPKLATPS